MAFLGPLATVASVAGSLVSGAASAASASYQARIAEMNSQIAAQNAERERERAALEAQKSDMEAKQLLGDQKALQGASGISMDSRSQMLTRKGSQRVARLDALNIAVEGEGNARNLENQSEMYKASAKMYKNQSKFAMFGGVLDAVGKGATGFKSYIASATPTKMASFTYG